MEILIFWKSFYGNEYHLSWRGCNLAGIRQVNKSWAIQQPVQFLSQRDECENFFMRITTPFIFLSDENVEPSAVFLYKAQAVGFKLTTLNFQSAVLFIQRVSPQIHHAGCCRCYSESKENHDRGDFFVRYYSELNAFMSEKRKGYSILLVWK